MVDVETTNLSARPIYSVLIAMQRKPELQIGLPIQAEKKTLYKPKIQVTN